MSVAFRRESDEEHKEPRFEIPIPVGPNLVTARGLAQARAEVIALEAAIAGKQDESLREEAARALRYWRTRLATAELQPAASGEMVAFGTRVTFRLKGRERTVAIVGDDEADPAAGSIAFSAPLARAMMGAEPGEHADFNGEQDAIEILNVALIEN